MSLFYVEKQPWQHWPNVLIMGLKGSNERKRYVPERTCEMSITKQGPRYITYHFSCCDEFYIESMTDAKANSLPATVCPYCGARVVNE